MPHIAEVTMARNIAALRESARPGPIDPDTRLVDGIYASWDPEANLSLDVKGPAQNGLNLQGTIRKAPRWFSLNLDLGTGTFSPGSVLGFVVRAEGALDRNKQLFVRSALKGTQDDTLLDESPGRGTQALPQIVLHNVLPDSPLTWENAFHTLILPLPTETFSLILVDLRVFVVSPETGRACAAPTLAKAAQ